MRLANGRRVMVEAVSRVWHLAVAAKAKLILAENEVVFFDVLPRARVPFSCDLADVTVAPSRG